MQTFVPYEDSFARTAQALDGLGKGVKHGGRLGSQCKEGCQLLEAIYLLRCNIPAAWQRHPAAQMWIGCEPCLFQYTLAMHQEWYNRKGVWRAEHATLMQHSQFIERHYGSLDTYVYPQWWGGPIHENHRARLVDKFPEYYGEIWPDVVGVSDNYWPTKVEAQ